MSELSDRLARHRDLPRHLAELSQLLGRSVSADDLLTLEQTHQARDRQRQVTRPPATHFEISFHEKQAAHFADFVRKLAQANPSDVYIWTGPSNTCGLLRPLPLQNIDLRLPFDWSPDGVLELLTVDLADRLVLDFFEDDNAAQRLAVEVSGAHWGQVQY